MSKQDNRFNTIGRGWNALFTTILCIVSLTMIIPMALVVVVSFSSELSIANKGFSFFPEQWSLEGYRYLAKMGDQVLRSYGITIFYTVTGTLMSLTVMSLYAYVLAQRSFRHHKFMTWILFFTMLFGGGLVPSYILNVRYLHIYDTVWVFLLPSLVSAYNVIILRTFIQTTIPESLFEAARIDGANHMQQIWHITLPGLKAVIAIKLIMSVGSILSSNTDMILLLYNTSTQKTADVIGTYVYRLGIQGGKFSYTTAVNLFMSLIAFLLTTAANKVSNKLTGSGLW